MVAGSPSGPPSARPGPKGLPRRGSPARGPRGATGLRGVGLPSGLGGNWFSSGSLTLFPHILPGVLEKGRTFQKPQRRDRKDLGPASPRVGRGPDHFHIICAASAAVLGSNRVWRHLSSRANVSILSSMVGPDGPWEGGGGRGRTGGSTERRSRVTAGVPHGGDLGRPQGPGAVFFARDEEGPQSTWRSRPAVGTCLKRPFRCISYSLNVLVSRGANEFYLSLSLSLFSPRPPVATSPPTGPQCLKSSPPNRFLRLFAPPPSPPSQPANGDQSVFLLKLRINSIKSTT